MYRTGQSQPSTREAAKTENRFARLIGTGRRPAAVESTCWWPLLLAGIKAAKTTGRPAVGPCHHLNHPSAARVVVHHLAEEAALLAGAARARESMPV